MNIYSSYIQVASLGKSEHIVKEILDNLKEHVKKEKIDFTSEQSWIKELDTWGERKVMAKAHRMGLDHYNFTFSEAKRYIAKNESRNGRDSRFGDCY